MGSLEKNIFGNKKFSDLLAEIYENQKKKEKTISGLVRELKDLVNDVSDATVIVPLIANYLEIGVKNDEHLVKLAAVIQRATSNKQEETSSFLTDEEKEALLKGIQEIQEEHEENNIGTKPTKDDSEWSGI